jgi:hypothetical protein
MRKQFTRVLISFCGLGLFLSLAAGGYASGPRDNLVLTILGRWKRSNGFGKTDPVTVSDPYEAMGGTMEGQMFYVPALPAADNQRLYRLYNRASDDHRDSLLPGEGDFRAEGTLGFPFKTQLPGTQAMRRDDAGNARLEVAPTMPNTPLLPGSGRLDEVADGAPTGPPLGYGFPRFANNGVTRLSVEGREVKLTANLVAGGAISELTWKGKQFINNFDFGRQIQTAINLSREAEAINPTEAGDLYGFPGTTGVAWAHGSPQLSSSVSGTTLKTQCHPLQWKPQNWGGGLGNPVMWQGTFGKRVDLDFGGSPHVIRWITTVNFPSAEPFVNMEVVTAYLNSEFTRFYALNAVTGALAEMTDLVPNGSCTDPQQDTRLRPPAGGVILATDDGAYALGVYHKGENTSFGLCKFLGYGGSGQYGFSTTKWNLLWRPPKGVQPGPCSITSYLLVGTLNQVVAEAKGLYQRGL